MLLPIAIFLALAGLEVVVARHFWGATRQYGFSKLFDVNVENNVPTWFSSISLFLCAAALWLTGRLTRLRRDPNTPYWWGIAAVFVMMSLDEVATMHEKLLNPSKNLFHTGGYLYYAWVIPGALFVLLFVGVTLRFLWRLPSRTRYRFILAGFVYLSGALGMEMVSANYEFAHGVNDYVLGLMAVVEETLEMAGSILFLRAVLLHLEWMSSPVEYAQTVNQLHERIVAA